MSVNNKALDTVDFQDPCYGSTGQTIVVLSQCWSTGLMSWNLPGSALPSPSPGVSQGQRRDSSPCSNTIPALIQHWCSQKWLLQWSSLITCNGVLLLFTKRVMWGLLFLRQISPYRADFKYSTILISTLWHRSSYGMLMCPFTNFLGCQPLCVNVF